MTNTATARYALIAGLAFVFVFFGIDKLLHPLVWIGWIPPSFDGLLGVSRNIWLSVIGFLEILFGIMILVPQRLIRKVGAVLIALHLVGVLTQTGWNDIAVRDIGLLCMAIGLWFLP